MRILITGSRDWTNRHAIEMALWRAVRWQKGQDASAVTVVHGKCRTGADALAHQVASLAGMAVEPHPADWKQFGRRAGFARNAEMVRLGADLCLAFVRPCSDPHCPRPRPHGSHGATGCALLAERAGIKVWYFYEH